MYTAYLLIGGNLGDRMTYLSKAVQLIEKSCGKVVQSSSIYETAAWGKTDQPDFYNQALILQTTLTPENLMQNLLAIEEQMGRKRNEKLGPRIIDLDILLVDSLVLNTVLLTLPHPALPNRRFALLPLAEIAPMLMHPVLHQNMSQLIETCPDKLHVQKKSLATN